MFGDGVHHDGEGDDVTAHNEDREQDLTETEQFATKPAHEDFAGIGQVMDEGVTRTELTDDVSGVESEETEADDEDDRAAAVRRAFIAEKDCGLRDNSQGVQRCWKREDTERDRLGNHDCIVSYRSFICRDERTHSTLPSPCY